MTTSEAAATAQVLKLSNQDLDFVAGLLSKAAQDVAAPSSNAGPAQEALQELCESTLTTLRRLSNLDTSTSSCAPDGQEPVEASKLAGTLDAEVLTLHQQVREAAARVQGLRSTVPQLMSQALTSQLAALRPSDIEAGTASAPASTTTPVTQPASEPELDALRGLLAEALDKMPNLRARLDGAAQRLGRVITVVEAEQSRPPPNTVEKVLLGKETPAGDDGAAAEQDENAAPSAPSGAVVPKSLARDLSAAVAHA